MTNRRFTLYALLVLAFNLLVILWGDVVQVTGSGDGCGAYWPTCNGAALPMAPSWTTFIEYFHRITSMGSGLLIIGLVVWGFRAFPKGSLVRFTALMSLVFVIVEGLLGASLVLFRLVGEDVSLARVILAPVHLVNTLFLISWIALTAWFSVRPERPVFKNQGMVGWALGLGFLGLIFVASSGALTSLGDALFPVKSTEEAIRSSLTLGEHFLVQLRIYHPFIAIGVSVYTVSVANLVASLRYSSETRLFARLVGIAFIAQLGMGFLNVKAAAPLYTQLPHLLMSDLVWLTWLLLAVSALSVRHQPRPAALTQELR